MALPIRPRFQPFNIPGDLRPFINALDEYATDLAAATSQETTMNNTQPTPRAWQAGDIANVLCSDDVWRRATCEPHANFTDVLVWRFPDRVFRHVDDSLAKRLLTIELPDGALAGWPTLIDALRRAKATTGLGMVFGGLINQIETQTKPPKPAEPTGLGAVVEDAHEKLWIRGRNAKNYWRREDGHVAINASGPWWDWEDIDAVTILNHGVTS